MIHVRNESREVVVVSFRESGEPVPHRQMISWNIAQIARLVAEKEGATSIIFTGSFLRKNHTAQRKFASAFRSIAFSDPCSMTNIRHRRSPLFVGEAFSRGNASYSMCGTGIGVMGNHGRFS